MKITKNGDCMVLELVLFLHKTFIPMNFKFVFKSFLALCALVLFREFNKQVQIYLISS